MSFDQHILLTDEQWWAVENISDVFAQASEFSEALSSGLNILLSVMQRSGGVVFVPGLTQNDQAGWVEQNTPSSWRTAMLDAQSPLALRVTQTMNSGDPSIWDGSTQPAALIPIAIGEKVYAVLLLAGPGLSADDLPLWQVMLHPFARAFAHYHRNKLPMVPGYPELMRSRNTLRAMFDSLPLSIYIIDNKYKLMAINHSRAGRAEKAPKDLVGKLCYEALYGRKAPCSGCRVMETLESGQGTLRLIRTGGEKGASLQWEMNTFPILDENDQVIQAIIVEQDVTEKRNLEANLIQSEKLAAVGQLAAGVAHEINNPLTAIIANAQLLLREIPPGDGELWDSVKLIEMAGTRASQVVRNLLGIARKEKYEFDVVDLNETLHNALALVQHELVDRPIQVSLDLAEHMPPVMASRDQLQGVWINLILNAIDAMDKPDGQITIQSVYAGAEFIVTIIDNGRGIAGDHLQRIFEPFFTTKSIGRGTGLGLSVCLRAIRHHGGDIQVESRFGEGTRFTVTLPEQRDVG